MLDNNLSGRKNAVEPHFTLAVLHPFGFVVQMVT